MKNKCIQCGNEKFEEGFLGNNLYVMSMNDKLSTFAKLISQGGKRVYAQECTTDLRKSNRSQYWPLSVNKDCKNYSITYA